MLLISASTEITDRLLELIECCDDGQLRVYMTRTLEDTEQLLEHRDMALAILDTTTLGDLAFLDKLSNQFTPKPTLALVKEGSAHSLKDALRAGADDVFALNELDDAPKLFCQSLKRQLHRARLVDEARSLRDSLERSLEELKTDQHAAQQVQQNLLPPPVADLNNIHIEYLLKPSLLLSGDFVEALAINDHLTLFYLADVSGHGASSALVTVLLKNMAYRLLRNYKRHSSFDILSPEKMLGRINKELLATRLGKHLTMFIGLIDLQTDSLIYAVAGHHPMPVMNQGGQVGFLEGRGMPLGLFEQPMFEEKRVRLEPDFILTLFSDGILEVAPGDDLEHKETVLLECCQKQLISPLAIANQLTDDSELNPDDVAIMTVSRKSES